MTRPCGNPCTEASNSGEGVVTGAVYAGANPHNTDRRGRVLMVCGCESFYFHVPRDWVREGCFVSCGGRRCRGQLVAGRLPRRGRRRAK